MRLIDADAFFKSEIERCGCVPLIGSCTADNEIFKFILEQQPTIEAQPVVYGEWIENTFGYFVCSKCKRIAKGDVVGFFSYRKFRQEKTNFCPNCGADMRKKV